MNYGSRKTTIWTMCKFSIPLLNCVVYQKCVFTIYSHKNWSKTNKNDQKSTKKGSAHYLKISPKTWKIKKRWSLNRSFDTTQKETGVPLFDKTVRDFPSKTMFFYGFVIFGQLLISSIYHEWTCLLEFMVRHRHTYNRTRFEEKKCRTFSYMLQCVQFLLDNYVILVPCSPYWDPPISKQVYI